MKKEKTSALYWAPRILGLGVVLFLGMFALDVFGEGYRFRDFILALFMHLIPSFIVLIALVIAWRRERLGGGLFIFLGLLYLLIFWRPERWVSYLIISGPLFVVGTLFLIHEWVVREDNFADDCLNGQAPG